MNHIHQLAKAGDKQGLATAIGSGNASVNDSDHNGNRALHFAARYAPADIVALLIGYRPEIDAKNNFGGTPLHEASKAGNVDIVMLLLSNNADPNSKDNENNTPLHYAIIGGHSKVAIKLMEHGAQQNIQNNKGQTPLHISAAEGNIDMVAFFVERGANVSLRDFHGNTPLSSIPLLDRVTPILPHLNSSLLSDIKSLYRPPLTGFSENEEDERTNTFTDLVFIVDGVRISAHRSIISCRCSRLRKMLKGGQSEEIEIRDSNITSTIFQAILEWIYTDAVALLSKSDPDLRLVFGILLAAERYQLSQLRTHCEGVLIQNLTTGTLGEVWTDARTNKGVAPLLYQYASQLVASHWDTVGGFKGMGLEMTNQDIADMVRQLTGFVKKPIKKAPPQTSSTSTTTPPPTISTPTPKPVQRPQNKPVMPSPNPVHTPPVAIIPQNTHTPHPALHPQTKPAPSPSPNPTNVQGVRLMEGRNLTTCKAIIKHLMSKRTIAWPFLVPVDPVALQIPDYFDVIKHPMDLGTIENKLKNGVYREADEFARDVKLVFDNACLYNEQHSEIVKNAEELRSIFESKFAQAKLDISVGKLTDYPIGQTTPNLAAKKVTKKPAPSPLAPPKPEVLPPPVVHHTPKPEIPREHVPAGIDMSFDEKKLLGEKMNQLTSDQLARVVNIISENRPAGVSGGEEDIEIDMNDLDALTLRKLEHYVNSCLPGVIPVPEDGPKQQQQQQQMHSANKSLKKRREDDEDVVIDDQDEDQHYPSVKIDPDAKKHKKNKEFKKINGNGNGTPNF
eukprot:TRINITY_DN5747_c0_g1_i5.p1 TRINITY_DN5747_c0_g1~~TRINITY_DN5747_c0_g1_i5.p1  ORF type:complete len:788 (+),score=178.77 TRINITY_DN5747_c0_g1_i5:305-2668(+)